MQRELRMLKEMLEQKLIEKQKEKENSKYIGELPVELIKMARILKKEKEHFEEDVDLKKQQIILELNRKMEQLFEDRAETLAKKQRFFWEEVYKAMMVDPEGTYYHENGSLFEVQENRKDEFENLFNFTKQK